MFPPEGDENRFYRKEIKMAGKGRIYGHGFTESSDYDQLSRHAEGGV